MYYPAISVERSAAARDSRTRSLDPRGEVLSFHHTTALPEQSTGLQRKIASSFALWALPCQIANRYGSWISPRVCEHVVSSAVDVRTRRRGPPPPHTTCSRFSPSSKTAGVMYRLYPPSTPPLKSKIEFNSVSYIVQYTPPLVIYIICGHWNIAPRLNSAPKL